MLSTAMLVAACSRDYSFTKAVYDGVQTRDQLNSTPMERGAAQQMNYQQYESERKSKP